MKTYIFCALPLALSACSSGQTSDEGEPVADDQIAVSAEDVEAESRAARVSPGQWEITSNLMGRESIALRCMSQEQIENPRPQMFTGEEQNCTYGQFDMSGGTMQMEARCEPEGLEGGMTLRLEGNYSADRYDMTMIAETRNMTLNGRTVGRRVGECPDAADE